MGLLSTLTGRGNGSDPVFDEQRMGEVLAQAGADYDALLTTAREAIAELELRLLDLSEPGWLPLAGGEGDFDFSRDFLDGIVHQSRLFAIKNPLVKAAVRTYGNYVFGQGFTVTAKGAVNEVVQRFLGNRGNRKAFCGHRARTRLNRALMTDGTLAFRLFPNGATGDVSIRPLRFEEVRARVTNPDDASEDWYWLRSYTRAGVPQQVLYPDVSYSPPKSTRPRAYKVAGAVVSIEWETPVYVMRVGDLEGMAFGIPEVYAGVDWARAYKEYLENWAKFVRSLTRWAWRMKTTGNQTAVDAAQAKIDTQFSGASTSSALVDANPAPVTGSTFVSGKGVEEMEPVKIAGSLFPSADGRRLLLMVAASVGLPETFFGDAEVGTLATAKSLDRPTELNFAAYQTSWGETYADLLSFVIDCAARAPKGLLRGLFAAEDPEQGIVTLKDVDAAGEPVTREIDIDWPPIVHDDTEARVDAIATAVKTGAIDDAPLVARMLLTALGEEDIDAALARLYPSDPDDEPEAIPLPKAAPVAAPTTPPPAAEEAPEREAADRRLAEALAGLRDVLEAERA